ncbi:hypothetical protein [Oceanobacillus iheyensis HTE831]|uniref:Uncharacterized protein n=2 Tax=Oceanobacillus iheyensis TaxID=182710 RepID=Q8CUX0_OCEIH|nr:hypothetical protein [Oceanobacillus iheyensis]BAC12943.1 hypothetical protein [Oceanobacillus iheyensis HTE831]
MVKKKHGTVSYISLALGITCFFIVFVQPTRIANIGSLIGDSITMILSAVGIILSLFGRLKKSEKNVIPTISLILSGSFIIYWVMIFILLITGIIDFAP